MGWPEIYGRRRGSPSHAWSGLGGSFRPLNLARLKLSWYILRHSLARARLSSCGDRIPRRPHRRVTFGIIILLSASSPSFLLLLLPPPHGTCSALDGMSSPSAPTDSGPTVPLLSTNFEFIGFSHHEASNVSASPDIFPLIPVPRVATPSHFESKLLLMTAITDSGCPARSTTLQLLLLLLRILN